MRRELLGTCTSYPHASGGIVLRGLTVGNKGGGVDMLGVSGELFTRNNADEQSDDQLGVGGSISIEHPIFV